MPSPDLERVEGVLAGNACVVACVPATPDGAVPATVGAVLAASLGLRPKPATLRRRWDPDGGGFVVDAPPVDLRSWRQVLVVLTEAPDQLAVIGVDAFGRPVTELWSVDLAEITAARTEPVRLHGVGTDALVIEVAGRPLRCALARPHRRAGRALASRIARAVDPRLAE